MEAKFLTEKQVAERYAIGLRQLRLMRMRGAGIKYIKPSGAIGKKGGRVLYAVADVEAYLAACPSGGGGERVVVWPPITETR